GKASSAVFPDSETPPLWGRLAISSESTSGGRNYRQPASSPLQAAAENQGTEWPGFGNRRTADLSGPSDPRSDTPGYARLADMPAGNPRRDEVENVPGQSNFQDANDANPPVTKVGQTIPFPTPGFGPMPPEFIPGTPQNREWRDRAIRTHKELLDSLQGF